MINKQYSFYYSRRLICSDGTYFGFRQKKSSDFLVSINARDMEAGILFIHRLHGL